MTGSTTRRSWQAVDSVVIRVPADRIFARLRDYNNVGELFGLGASKTGYSTRILGDEPLVEEGSIVEHRYPIFSFRRRIEKLEPHRRIVERYIGPNYEGTGIWELEQLRGGVKLSYVYDAADTGWVSKLLYRLAGTRAHHHFYSHALARLKRRLEAETE